MQNLNPHTQHHVLKEWVVSQPLHLLTTMQVGGTAQLYQSIHTIGQMQACLQDCQTRHINWMVLGRGSNTLFDDHGFTGAVLHNKISFLENRGDGVFFVGAGYNFSLLGTQTARAGWGGLEYACGIPGSVGGAIFMNAGANGQETIEVLKEVWFLHPSGELERETVDPAQFSYRFSPYQKDKKILVAAIFHLYADSKAREKQKHILASRMRTQPYGEKSCGSFFRNPTNAHAAALIEQTGWKGNSIGGAMVSPIHANFLINTGTATTRDILLLSCAIAESVFEKTGIQLESEVCYFSANDSISR